MNRIEYQLRLAVQALEYYADPETYFAIVAMGDSPCGDFINDVSKTYDGYKYGKKARDAFKQLVKPKLRMRIKRKFR